mgnify:CR=1 FL=1
MQMQNTVTADAKHSNCIWTDSEKSDKTCFSAINESDHYIGGILVIIQLEKHTRHYLKIIKLPKSS